MSVCHKRVPFFPVCTRGFVREYSVFSSDPYRSTGCFCWVQRPFPSGSRGSRTLAHGPTPEEGLWQVTGERGSSYWMYSAGPREGVNCPGQPWANVVIRTLIINAALGPATEKNMCKSWRVSIYGNYKTEQRLETRHWIKHKVVDSITSDVESLAR